MSCDHDALMIQALVDGELDAAHAAETEARIETCPECAAEHDRLIALRAALRGSGCPARRARSVARAARASLAVAVQDTSASPTSWFRCRRRGADGPWAWAGGGAGVAIAACAALFLATSYASQNQALTQALVDSHVRSLQVAPPDRRGDQPTSMWSSRGSPASSTTHHRWSS